MAKTAWLLILCIRCSCARGQLRLPIGQISRAVPDDGLFVLNHPCLAYEPHAACLPCSSPCCPAVLPAAAYAAANAHATPTATNIDGV